MPQRARKRARNRVSSRSRVRPQNRDLKKADSIFSQLLNALQGKSSGQGPVIKPMPPRPPIERIPYGFRGSKKSPLDPDLEVFFEGLDFSRIPKEPKEPKGPQSYKGGRPKGKKR